MSVGRLLISTAVAIFLPGYLTHRLPVKTYSAWVLVLQMSAYVSYLDFGVQVAISKYVAEYEARQDVHGANMRASAGLAIMLAASMLGVVLTVVLMWQMPRLFNDMPAALYRDVRISLLLVGFSLSFNLVCSVTSAIFLGLQRYTVPTLTMLANRILFTIVVITAVAFHASLAVMGAAAAAVNVATGAAQVVAWRSMAGRIRLSLRALDLAVVRQMISYCSVLAIWTVGMLCVSGLDVTIVGRYDFSRTAYYSIASLPTNFLISILSAALGPFLPAASARDAASTPLQMGQMLSRVTRYCVVLLNLTGLPLLVGGYWILRLWVGTDYAVHALPYMRILVVANMIRTICLPYAMMLVATDKQKVAIGGAAAEALVNLGASVYLAQHIGAIGVAIGTLLGSFVSVGMHFAVNMRFTYPRIQINRANLFTAGILRPMAIAIPSLLCVRMWWSASAPSLSVSEWIAWGSSTLAIAWISGLFPEERIRLHAAVRSRLRPAVL